MVVSARGKKDVRSLVGCAATHKNKFKSHIYVIVKEKSKLIASPKNEMANLKKK